MPFRHRDLKLTDNHVVHAFEFADEATRLAATVTAADVGKVAFQLSDKTFWLLASVGPASWTAMAGGGGGSLPASERWSNLGILLQPTQPTGLVTYEQWLASGGVGHFGWIQTPTSDVVFVTGSPITFEMAFNPGTTILDVLLLAGSSLDFGMSIPLGTVAVTGGNIVDVFGSAPLDFGMLIPLGVTQLDVLLLAGSSIDMSVTMPLGVVTLESAGVSPLDDFNRADSSTLGTGWNLAPGQTWPVISSNKAAGTGGSQGAYRSEVNANDQWAAAQVDPNNHRVQIKLRQDTGANTDYLITFYRYQLFDTELSEWYWSEGSVVQKVVTGVTTTLVGGASPGASTHVKAQIAGNTITIYGATSISGPWTQLATVTDSTSPIASGRIGIGFDPADYGQTQFPGSHAADAFWGGDL